mgnify:CR=1 FL=1
MSSESILFTSESVSEGHPDKVADNVSDAILDAMLAQDPKSRVACETMVTTGVVMVAGEITSNADVDIPAIIRETILDIGYNGGDSGFDGASCAVLVSLDKQSADIAQGVNEGEGIDKEQGAGDQGMMFGYACNETPELMPLPVSLAHKILGHITKLRKEGTLPWLQPDAKSQVTVEYVDGKPVRIDTIVVSNQHSPNVEHKEIYDTLVKSPTTSIRRVVLWSVVLWAIAALRVVRLSWIPMVVWAVMAVVPSVAKIPPR